LSYEEKFNLFITTNSHFTSLEESNCIDPSELQSLVEKLYDKTHKEIFSAEKDFKQQFDEALHLREPFVPAQSQDLKTIAENNRDDRYQKTMSLVKGEKAVIGFDNDEFPNNILGLTMNHYEKEYSTK
jgi:hypothetical protein